MCGTMGEFVRKLLILVWAQCALAKVSEGGGWRIAGGLPALPEQFPYVASLRIAEDGVLWCAGSIIHPKWILTAGHCIEESEPSDWFVVVGTIYVNSARHPGYRYDLANIVLHENYSHVSTDDYIDSDNDIALLELKMAIYLSVFAQVIKLQPYPVGEMICTSVGWGELDYPTDHFPHSLRYIQMRVISQNMCKRDVYPNRLHPNELCTFSGNGRGNCRGDSGGPLVDRNGLLIGIASWVIPCGIGYPDVFVRVSSYYYWIRQYVDIL